MQQQLPPCDRRRHQQVGFCRTELEQIAPAGKYPRDGRERHERQRRKSQSAGLQRRHHVGRRRRGAAAPPRCRPPAADAHEHCEIEIRNRDGRSDHVPRLAQPPQPHARPVPRTADDNVQARPDHRDVSTRERSPDLRPSVSPGLLFSTGAGGPRPARTDADTEPGSPMSSARCGRRRSPPARPARHRPVMRMKICSRLDPAAAISACEASSANVPSATIPPRSMMMTREQISSTR